MSLYMYFTWASIFVGRYKSGITCTLERVVLGMSGGGDSFPSSSILQASSIVAWECRVVKVSSDGYVGCKVHVML